MTKKVHSWLYLTLVKNIADAEIQTWHILSCSYHLMVSSLPLTSCQYLGESDHIYCRTQGFDFLCIARLTDNQELQENLNFTVCPAREQPVQCYFCVATKSSFKMFDRLDLFEQRSRSKSTLKFWPQGSK